MGVLPAGGAGGTGTARPETGPSLGHAPWW
jgi:hypothetical protein